MSSSPEKGRLADWYYWQMPVCQFPPATASMEDDTPLRQFLMKVAHEQGVPSNKINDISVVELANMNHWSRQECFEWCVKRCNAYKAKKRVK